MRYAIEISNLKKQFIKEKGFIEFFLHPIRKEIITALDGVSLKIKKGEICGLLGPNGAGKTTLIKILSTLILPDSGKAYVNGCDVVKQEYNVKDSIGLIHHNERSFFWRLTGRQNLEFFASLYGIKKTNIKEEVNKALGIVGLKEKAHIRFDSYSTGMKRKMSIARGLLTNPDILFVDEPSNGLDPLSAIKIRKFLKEELVNKMRKTVLMATHDLKEAQSICDNIVILHKGKIKTQGTLKKLQKKNGTESIDIETKTEKKVISEIKKLKGVKEIETNGRNLNIKVSSTHTLLPEIIKLISINNGKIYNCKTNHIDLDKIFEKFAGD
ncbi:ABC transporter ATP-binding protein [Candidatus Woesearchaeota archaeon]|nr:ABC transporter ATP-binding protein [Candidatus Woesearchaeota archaeon]